LMLLVLEESGKMQIIELAASNRATTETDNTTIVDSTADIPLTAPSLSEVDVETDVVIPNDQDEDDDLTIIGLEQDPEQGGGVVRGRTRQNATAWIEQQGPEMEARRRILLLRELQRVQRASFIHFFLLCLIPTSLLIVLVAIVLGENQVCTSQATTCIQEARTFLNAFTTRCICDAIDVTDRGN